MMMHKIMILFAVPLAVGNECNQTGRLLSSLRNLAAGSVRSSGK